MGTRDCLTSIRGVQEKRAYPGSGTVECVWSRAIVLVSSSRNLGSTAIPDLDYVVSGWVSRIKWKKCSGEAIACETGYLYIHAFFTVSDGSRKSNGPANSRGWLIVMGQYYGVFNLVITYIICAALQASSRSSGYLGIATRNLVAEETWLVGVL